VCANELFIGEIPTLVQVPNKNNYNKTQKDIRYLLTLEVSQSHISLNINDLVKDSMNKVTFIIAVDKLYYEKVSVGDNILKSFRAGSFFISGSIGSWNIKVLNKQIEAN
jgi:hypothetical protein